MPALSGALPHGLQARCIVAVGQEFLPADIRCNHHSLAPDLRVSFLNGSSADTSGHGRSVKLHRGASPSAVGIVFDGKAYATVAMPLHGVSLDRILPQYTGEGGGPRGLLRKK